MEACFLSFNTISVNQQVARVQHFITFVFNTTTLHFQAPLYALTACVEIFSQVGWPLVMFYDRYLPKIYRPTIYFLICLINYSF